MCSQQDNKSKVRISLHSSLFLDTFDTYCYFYSYPQFKFLVPSLIRSFFSGPGTPQCQKLVRDRKNSIIWSYYFEAYSVWSILYTTCYDDLDFIVLRSKKFTTDQVLRYQPKTGLGYQGKPFQIARPMTTSFQHNPTGWREPRTSNILATWTEHTTVTFLRQRYLNHVIHIVPASALFPSSQSLGRIFRRLNSTNNL